LATIKFNFYKRERAIHNAALIIQCGITAIAIKVYRIERAVILIQSLCRQRQAQKLRCIKLMAVQRIQQMIIYQHQRSSLKTMLPVVAKQAMMEKKIQNLIQKLERVTMIRNTISYPLLVESKEIISCLYEQLMSQRTHVTFLESKIAHQKKLQKRLLSETDVLRDTFAATKLSHRKTLRLLKRARHESKMRESMLKDARAQFRQWRREREETHNLERKNDRKKILRRDELDRERNFTHEKRVAKLKRERWVLQQKCNKAKGHLKNGKQRLEQTMDKHGKELMYLYNLLEGQEKTVAVKSMCGFLQENNARTDQEINALRREVKMLKEEKLMLEMQKVGKEKKEVAYTRRGVECT